MALDEKDQSQGFRPGESQYFNIKKVINWG